MTRLFRILPACLLLLATGHAAENDPRTRVRIAGMKTLSENEALSLIGDRLEHVKSQPPGESRASDAAFMARQLFRNNGFNQCEVAWKITGPSEIQLIVTEGPRDVLGEVSVLGVDKETSKRLERLYENPAEKRRQGIGERPPFREEDMTAGLELVVADFHSRGYWKAEAEVAVRRKNPENGRIDLAIRTNPGPLYVIGGARFTGAQLKVDGIPAVTAPFVGRPADTGAVNGMRSAVETFYRQRGFTDAKIRMTSVVEDGKFQPVFEIEEGRSFKLGKISYEGLVKTDSVQVRRRFQDLEGKTLDATVLEKRLRGMMATGAFSSVRTEKVQRDENTMDATLRFEEGEARGYTLSAGAGSYEGIIAGVSYYDRNFRGSLNNLTAGGEMSARSLLGEVSLTDPWLWGTDVSGSARLFMLSRSNEGYSTWKAGGELGAIYPVTDHYQLDLRAGWTFVNSNEDGIPGALMGETVYQNPYIRFKQRLDYRDNAVLPTKGWLLEAPLEFGGAIGDVSTGYLKAELMGSYYYPLTKKDQLAFGARGGVLMASGDTDDLPIDLRFFLGGSRSVRSYGERELGPRSFTGYPLGGEGYWVTNFEYIRTVSGPFKVVGFVDAGNLTRRWEDIGSGGVDVAAGLGIRIDLPVGPVRLEYGHNLTRQPNEPSGAWHFAIGLAF